MGGGFDGPSALEINSYYDVDISSTEGNVWISAADLIHLEGLELSIATTYAYYNGYEIATLNDIPDISGLESDIQWVNYQITDPGAILDRLDDLEGRVYNLENP